MFDFLIFLQSGQPTPPQGGASWLTTIVFFGAAFLIIYLMILRPQSQARKKQGEFSSALKKGKKVVTIGGLHGTISELNETQVTIIIAPKTHITVQRDCISMEWSNTIYGSDDKTAEK